MNELENSFWNQYKSFVDSKPQFSVYDIEDGFKIADCIVDIDRDINCNGDNFLISEIKCNFESLHRQNTIWVEVTPQESCGHYKTDFGFVFSSRIAKIVKLAIEIDGHDWHEKTKEQALHDKKRDREILMTSNIPVHFTGSEIFTNPVACFNNIYNIGISQVYNAMVNYMFYFDYEIEINTSILKNKE